MGSWTLTSSGAAFAKAGLIEGDHVGLNEDVSGAVLLQSSDEAESRISVISNLDIVTDFATKFTAEGKQIFSALASNMIAQDISNMLRVQYGQREWETILDIIENNIDTFTGQIEKKGARTYLKVT